MRTVLRGRTPSDVQLANFAALRCFGVDATSLHRRAALALVEASPTIRKVWVEQHSAFQDELRRLAAPAPDGLIYDS